MTFLVGCYATCAFFLMSFVGSFPSASFTGAFVYSRGIPLQVPNRHQPKNNPSPSVGASGVRRRWVGLDGRPIGINLRKDSPENKAPEVIDYCY